MTPWHAGAAPKLLKIKSMCTDVKRVTATFAITVTYLFMTCCITVLVASRDLGDELINISFNQYQPLLRELKALVHDPWSMVHTLSFEVKTGGF